MDGEGRKWERGEGKEKGGGGGNEDLAIAVYIMIR